MGLIEEDRLQIEGQFAKTLIGEGIDPDDMETYLSNYSVGELEFIAWLNRIKPIQVPAADSQMEKRHPLLEKVAS